MIAAWMIASTLTGGALLLLAFAVEYVAASFRRPRRWVWALVMPAMLVFPLVPRPVVPFSAPQGLTAGPAPAPVSAPGSDAQVRAARGTSTADGAVPPLQDEVPSARGTDAGRPDARRGTWNRLVVAPDSTLARLSGPVLVLWVGLSLVAVGLIGTAIRRLQRIRHSWDGADDALHSDMARRAGRSVRVWRSPDVGPAAFGIRAPQVVLPDWVDDLAEGERSLLLAHEASHVRAGDPRLLAAALALVARVPWHLPLLLAYRRLCRAVEHDCDARVLATAGDARCYGRLLVRTAEWLVTGQRPWRHGLAARWILAPVPAFAARASELEERLRALAPGAVSWRTRATTGLAGVLGALALVAACVVPRPTPGSAALATPPTPLDSLIMMRSTGRQLFGSMERMDAIRDSVLLQAAAAAIPGFDRLRASRETTYVWLVVDDRYRPVDHVVTGELHRFLWVGSDIQSSEGEPPAPRPARAADPRNRWYEDTWSWARAFPTLDPDRIHAHGGVTPGLLPPNLRLHWAELFPGDSTGLQFSLATTGSVRIESWYRTFATTVVGRRAWSDTVARALAYGLREGVAITRPEYLEPDNAAAGPVWLLLGANGIPMMHSVGGEPAGSAGPPFRSGGASGFATDPSAAAMSGITTRTWHERFPTFRGEVLAFGRTILREGGRAFTVHWAVTDVSFAVP
ncbi:MAG: M56 family metallopeptidase [Gemmatimonadota bacterium]